MDSIIDNVERIIVAKILPNEDIIDAIREMVIKYEIISGNVNIIGALSKATIGFFDITKNYLLAICK